MFVFDCEASYQPDNGQNDVTDGSVENYDFDWGQPLDTEPLDDALTDDERDGSTAHGVIVLAAGQHPGRYPARIDRKKGINLWQIILVFYWMW